MTTKFKKGDVIQVDWGDAWAQSGWRERSETDCKASMATNIGVFLCQTKAGILMAQVMDEHGTPNSVFFIPRGMIKKEKLLLSKNKIKTDY